MVYLRIHTAPMREASGEIVGGAGHYPSVEAPDETLRVVQAFLADS